MTEGGPDLDAQIKSTMQSKPGPPFFLHMLRIASQLPPSSGGLSLMTWMGHKRIDEAMRYVHVASAHARELPRELVEATVGEYEPDRQVLKMLGARTDLPVLRQPDGINREACLKVACF
jgi:hypothetical protein